MNILSRRKRLLNRTPKAPKMSTRRQFHRALRRHPAWPAVMEQAAARARAQEGVKRDRTDATAMGRAAGRSQVRRAIRRNRAGIVSMIVVGAIVALLNGIGFADGAWSPRDAQSPVHGPSPSGRFGAATTFDMNRMEMLMFGGFGYPGTVDSQVTGGISARDDTWGVTGSWSAGASAAWINRNPVHRPSPRGFASMVYDGARRNVVLFGGAPYKSNAVSGETWIWNGSDWTLLDPPEPRPPARQNASMVYDAHRKLVVMFGGRDATGASLNDTWTWDGSAWKKLKPPVSPTPRHSAAMEYDVCRGEAVLFGGSGFSGANLLAANVGDLNVSSVAGETWIWDGASWAKKNPVPSPSPRIGASMTYSYKNGRVLMYGGLFTPDSGDPSVAVDEDVWIWDGSTSTWEKSQSEVSTAVRETFFLLLILGSGNANALPPPRAYATFAFDRKNEHVIHLFGGTPGAPSVRLTRSSDRQDLRQAALFDHWYLDEEDQLPTQVRSCANPVPLPSDGASVGDPDEGVQTRKVEIRDEVREIGRLPVLLGETPNPVQNLTKPGDTPQPDCPRRTPSESVSNTHLATDPKRNRIYQFFMCNRPDGHTSRPHRILIQAYDGISLKPLGSVIVPFTHPVGSLPSLKENLLHDADRGRFLYRVERDLYVIQQDLIENGVNPVVAKTTLAGTGTISSVHLFNHPKTGRPKLLVAYPPGGATIGPPPSDTTPPTMVQLDLETNSQNWSRPIEGCSSALTGGMRAQGGVYTSCRIASGTLSGAVKIPIIENPDGSETPQAREIFPGIHDVVRAWGDPTAERLVLAAQNNFSGSVVWTFEANASRYVGRSGIAGFPSTGFDQEIGRLYVHTPDSVSERGAKQGGLLVLDTRLTPAPQAINFFQFASPAEAEISILPSRGELPRRVFIRRASGATPSDPSDPKQAENTSDSYKRYPDGETVKTPDDMHYLVLADSLPVPEQPKFEQQDALTVPVAESAGKTEVTFDAEGSGWGIRLRSKGGVYSIPRPPPQTGTTANAGDFRSANLDPFPPCFYPDRELIAGWVPWAQMSDLSASARGAGLEVDSSTKTDLAGPSTRCIPDPGGILPSSVQQAVDVLWPLLPFAQLDNAIGSGLRWDRHFREAECAGDSSVANKATIGDVYGSANCRQKDSRVEGISRGALAGSFPSGYSVTSTMNASLVALPEQADYSVGEGYSKVVVSRESLRGVVVTSTAVAKAIKLPGISIDLVKTEAVSSSNGRPPAKDDRASFTRTICGVTLPPPGPSITGCLNEAQQKQMEDEWNRRWGINGKMARPMPDPNFLKGTPGGYAAGVVRPQAEEVEDQLFGTDNLREIPGLRIVFYKDSAPFGNDRQVLELAAVRAFTGYGIQCSSDLVYSPSDKNCVALALEDAFLDEPGEEEFGDDEEFSSLDETELDGGWVPVEATGAPAGLALGSRIGRFLDSVPVIRRLPIREMGEALLAGSVWLLLGLPLALASRRFAMNLARRS